MRREFVARRAAVVRSKVLQLPMQQAHLLLQQVDHALLADHGLIQGVEQIFCKSEFGLDLGDSVFSHTAVAFDGCAARFSSRR